MSDQATQVSEVVEPKAKKSPKKKVSAKAKVESNGQPKSRKDGLRLPQIRVLNVLAKKGSALSRSKISQLCGNKTTVVVGRAVGYSDPVKRKAFESTKDGGFTKSLLSLGYVREIELDIDGAKETAIEITASGKKAFDKAGVTKMPALRD